MKIGRSVPRWLMPVLSVVLTLIALGFVWQRVSRDRGELVEAIGGLRPAPAVLALVFAAFGMTWIAVVWKLLVEQMGAEFSYQRAISSYYVGELGKYIPGGLWPILGRGELARRAGVKRSIAYPSVLMSLALLYITSAAISSLLIPVAGLNQRITIVGYVLIVLCAVAGYLLLTPAALGALQRRIPISRLNEVPRLALPALLRLSAFYIPTWLAIGVSTSLIAVAVSDDVNMFHVAIAAIVSWLVGFLVFPVPGGLGIRESVLILFAGLGEVDGVTVALLSRFLFVFVDVAGFLLGVAARKLEIRG